MAPLPVVVLFNVGKEIGGGGGAGGVTETTFLAGQEVTVPVVLHGSGTESALSFSLQFDPDQLTYVQAQAVSPSGLTAVLNQNTAQAAQGRLGFALALQAGQTFPAGPQEVLRVTFAVKPDARGAVSLSFANQPVAREVATVEAQPIAHASWTGRSLALALPTPEISPAAEPGKLVFRWPANLTGVYLEATDDLAHPNWSRVGLAAEEVNGQMQLSLPADAARKFYRLRTEP